VEAISRRTLLSAIAGLAAASCYDNAGDGDLRFFAMGDWGSGGDDQKKVAAQMGRSAAKLAPDFIISTGDNFYPGGVRSVDDEQFVSKFTNVYADSKLQVPWYITLGNHDHRGKTREQINYSERNPQWRLPGAYYKHSQPLTRADGVDFFHIDTTAIIYSDKPAVDEQLAWLENALASSGGTWKIVVGHHPVHSGGRHGSTKELILLLSPLFARYGVHAYLNGHDHHMEHVIVDGTHYLTTGAGSKPQAAKGLEGNRFVVGEKLGFLVMRLTRTELEIAFIDDRGNTLYAANNALAEYPASQFKKSITG
jgi:acid phosphatase